MGQIPDKERIDDGNSDEMSGRNKVWVLDVET